MSSPTEIQSERDLTKVVKCLTTLREALAITCCNRWSSKYEYYQYHFEVLPKWEAPLGVPTVFPVQSMGTATWYYSDVCPLEWVGRDGYPTDVWHSMNKYREEWFTTSCSDGVNAVNDNCVSEGMVHVSTPLFLIPSAVLAWTRRADANTGGSNPVVIVSRVFWGGVPFWLWV